MTEKVMRTLKLKAMINQKKNQISKIMEKRKVRKLNLAKDTTEKIIINKCKIEDKYKQEMA